MATVADRLAEAEAEYHALITGTKPRVVVDQNGERVEFTTANAGRLRQYIESLKGQLSNKTSGPMRVFF
ncbi:hypothetical protein [Marinobacter phage PS6]|uniref:gpW family head-tail joining protein n=1 Tax=Marinobacter sp. DS40M6 TaxID=1597776 RepID=UPI000C0C2A9C|nr:gpW family head-tail joining protein [Marinobacter sp. DS40M6]ATN93252.1 hypothetical protein [Marinobacter phage PS6]MDC8457831.1 hypothetical protein [Marinobacter sp. DS40M6]